MSNQIRDLAAAGVLDEALQADVAILYKHSPFCPTSRRAMEEVRYFSEHNPEVPVYMVNVVRDRALSRQLAENLGVLHQSPQAILLRVGSPQEHVSHHKVKAGILEKWLTETE
jgi:bacillithiol system protein YtxJ